MRFWLSHEAAEGSQRRRSHQASLQALGIRTRSSGRQPVILQTEQPTHHRIAIPAHTPLRIGTLNAILAAVAAHKGVSKEAILRGA